MAMKSTPPLGTLSSFLSTGIMLSYFAYSDEVEDLMNKISQNSRRYLRKHRKFLTHLLTIETSAHLLESIRESCKQREPVTVEVCGLES